jgi:iron complex outermembrane receptor protein
MMLARKSVVFSAVSGAALLASSSAYAQPAATAPDPSPATGDSARAGAGRGGLEEIVVTAQRREQRLQEVPIAVTALSGNVLQANRIENISDLTGVVPGLYTRNNAGGLSAPAFTLRGVQSSSQSASQDREVSVYLDGVYLGSGRGAIFDLPDTERIEVLRGPQGTLFGRNSTAGAVSIVTRNPRGEFGFRQDFTIGNYNQLRTRTSVDLPAIGPFSAYVTYVHDERDGDVRNLGAGTTFDRTGPATGLGVSRSPKRLGGKNFENIFAALRFAPSSDFTMTYKFDQTRGYSSSEVRTTTALNTNSPIGNLLAQVLAAQPAGGGRYGPVFLNPGDRRPDAYNNAYTQYGPLFVQGHSLTTQWQVSDNLVLKNITGYRKSRVYGLATVVGLSGLEFTPGALQAYVPIATGGALSAQGITPQNTPNFGQIFAATAPLVAQGLAQSLGQYFAAYEGNNYGRESQFSTELQAIYTSPFMDLTVGGLYYHANEIASGVPGMAANYAFQPLPTLLPLGGVVEDRAKVNSYAGYAQADFHLTDKLDLQLGGRVTHDRKDTSLTQGGVLTGTRTNGTITGTTAIRGIFKTTKPTYSIGLNYKLSPDTLIYVKHATGFLSGGAVGDVIFNPELASSYEAGLKTDLFDRRLRVNGAIWRATYKHFQSAQAGITIGRPEIGALAVDAGTIKAYGAELEVTAQPIEGVTLGGQVGYTHTKLINVSPLFLLTQSQYLIAGNPDWVGGAYGQYVTPPFFKGTTMLFRLDGNYRGKYRAVTDPNVATTNPAFAPYQFSPGRWILNGRVALRDVPIGDRAKGELALWGRNLANNRLSSMPFAFSNFLFTNSYERARTWGVDFTFRY